MDATPGPWSVGASFRVYNRRALPIIARGVVTIGAAFNPRPKGPLTPEDHANAALFAAAPDLLQALMNLRDELQRGGMGYLLAEADAAIAKATGAA